MTIVDVGGQRSERRKWLHCFDSVTSVIYLAAIDEYNMTLEEDPTTNRLDESLQLFEDMTNSVFLEKASWMLFMNKCDLFREKIAKIPISTCFSDCTAKGYEQSLVYLKDKFQERFKSKNKLYIHPTCAIDTQNCKRVFGVVRHTIVTASFDSF